MAHHAPSSCDLVLENVLLPGGRVADLSLLGGTVLHVGEALPSEQQVDCRGMTVLPAAVDMHVHMRGGGSQRAKEDWRTGSAGALAGGVTVVVDQPNTVPPLTTAGAFSNRIREAMEECRCRFAVNGGVTPGGSLADLWDAGAMVFGEIFAAPSSYGEGLDDAALSGALRDIAGLDSLATIHAEEVAPGEDRDLLTHHLLRSPEGEVRAVERVHALNGAGCRIHLCHLSTAESVKAAGGATVEVCPHHLLLSIEDFDRRDPHGKVNPPLRPERIRRRLWSVWEEIDVLASDHAPHTGEEKSIPFSGAPSGLPGVETMVPLLLASCRDRGIPLASLIEKTSWRPAEILGIPKAGYLAGDRADFAIYPQEAESICADGLHGKPGWTPYEGMDAVFPKVVVMKGRVVFREGEFFPSSPEWLPGRGYKGAMQMKNGADTAQP